MFNLFYAIFTSPNQQGLRASGFFFLAHTAFFEISIVSVDSSTWAFRTCLCDQKLLQIIVPGSKSDLTLSMPAALGTLISKNIFYRLRWSNAEQHTSSKATTQETLVQ
jgi:hypothetical protein